MTTNVISMLGDKWLPLSPEQFFAPQIAADMWFGNELPPTAQAELTSPATTQLRAMLGMQIVQGLYQGRRRHIAQQAARARRRAIERVGGGQRASRHH